MAYDPVRKVTVLFGGHDNCVARGDTWEWDGSTWKEVNVGGSGPAARYGHAMVYHPGKKMVLLFGGVTGCSSAVYYHDLWGWNGQQWVNLTAANETIPRRAGHILAYDRVKQRLVMFGGYSGTGVFNDTWFWKNAWSFHTLPPQSVVPLVMPWPVATYESDNALLMVSNKNFYHFDGTAWHDASGSTDPPITYASAMVAVPDWDAVFLYGGNISDHDRSYSDESWIWWNDGWQDLWTSYKMANNPPPRNSHAMAYDQSRQEVLLFGGYTPSGATNEFWILHSPGPRYAAPTGTDTGTCREPGKPCKTIRYALLRTPQGGELALKAGDYDTVNQGAASKDETLLINKSVRILGGFNSAFTSQNGVSRIVGFEAGLADGPRAITVKRDVKAELRHVEVWWGTAKLGGGIYNDGDLTIRDSTVTYGAATLAGGCIFGTPNSRLAMVDVTIADCRTYGDADGAGIYSNGYLSTFDTVLTRNTAGRDGGGIYQWGGWLGLINTTLRNNTARSGGGLYTDYVDNSRQIQIQNVDIVYNDASQDGGGIFFKYGYGIANNVSLLRNRAGAEGGGVKQTDANVHFSNSVLAWNQAGGQGANCRGIIASDGYNLIGSSAGCSYNAAAGDQVGTAQKAIDPKLDANGVPLPGSPAADRGSPITLGNVGGCAPDDRTGFDRSQTPPCDIGAYEARLKSKTLPLLPDDTRYVSATGNDANDCLSPQTACATLPRALVGLPYNGTIAVAGQTFMPGDSETWYVGQAARFSGGWNDAFTQQTGWTTLNGQGINRGLTVGREGAATFENFVVQNGAGTWGGGALNEGGLTLLKSLVVDNQAERGGGVYNMGDLQLVSTLVARNNATEQGGGFYQQDGSAVLDHLTLTANAVLGAAASAQAGGQAAAAGGIYRDEGELVVYNSILAFNPSSSQDDTCPNPGLFDAIEYSLFTDARCGAAGEQGNLVGDPQFVAPQQGDYHLVATSPAIDHGQPQAAPSLDFENDARPCHPPAAGEERPDMGFDEYSQGYVCYSAVKEVYLPLIYR